MVGVEPTRTAETHIESPNSSQHERDSERADRNPRTPDTPSTQTIEPQFQQTSPAKVPHVSSPADFGPKPSSVDLKESVELDAESLSLPVSTASTSIPKITTHATMRQWSSADKKFTANARLRAFKRGYVLVEKQTGGNASVQLKKLCKSDHEYVANVIRVNSDAMVIVGNFSPGDRRGEVNVVDMYGKNHKVRLASIKLADILKENGVELYKLYLNAISGVSGWAEVIGTDVDGTRHALLYVDGRNINLELVGAGTVLYDNSYFDRPRLLNAEYIAKQNRAGVWAED